MKLFYHNGKMVSKKEKIREMKKQELYNAIYDDNYFNNKLSTLIDNVLRKGEGDDKAGS